MPVLHYNLAGRLTEAGLGGSLQDSLTLASSGSLATVETFREGPFATLRAAMLGGRDAGIFRQGPEEPPEQNAGGDTVPGSTASAFVLTVGGASQQGFVNTPADQDWYRVQLVAGQSYVFTANANGSGLDPFLEVRDSNGVLLSIDDDGGAASLDSLLRFTAQSTGTYFINVRAFTGEGQSSEGAYTLTAAIGPPQDPLDTIDFHYTAPTTIQVYFATDEQSFGGATAVRDWTQAEMNAVMAALATFAAISPLSFSITNNQAQAEFTLVLADLEDNVLGWFSPGQGVGAFAPDTTSWTTPGSLSPGGSAFATLIHEFGHAFGLAHPHDNGGFAPGSEIMQGVLEEFGSFGTFGLNQGVFTVMSYNDGSATVGATTTQGHPQTPMALDIALLQQRYGVNPTTNQGDTVYTIGAVNALAAIWDVSGIDTIQYGGANNATIDLRSATLLSETGGGGFISWAQSVRSGFTIANGVLIENATGGTGSDTLIGNESANTLTGNFGFDTLNGNGGNDRLNGGAQADLLNGGAGVDTAVYSVASTSGTWVRNVSGTWTVNGEDTLNSVEFLDFTDRDVFLDRAQRTFSGNGTSDVLFRRADGIMASWEVTGTTINAASFLPTAGPEWSVLATGDISGDGKDDVIWKRNDGLIYAWIMNGGALSAAVGVTGVANDWTFLGMGDFNGDLVDDLAWQRNDGIVVTWTMQNSALQSANVVTGLGGEWQIAGFGDFNGDGRDDFLWRRTDNGQTVVWHMNGSSIQSSGFTSVQTGLDWAVVGVGDTNRDGYDDIILQRASDGMVAVWAMNGTTVLSNTQVAAANPAQWTIQGIGDYNGDGREDILWQRNDGLVYVWLMNGSSILSAGALSGIGPEWTIL